MIPYLHVVYLLYLQSVILLLSDNSNVWSLDLVDLPLSQFICDIVAACFPKMYRELESESKTCLWVEINVIHFWRFSWVRRLRYWKQRLSLIVRNQEHTSQEALKSDRGVMNRESDVGVWNYTCDPNIWFHYIQIFLIFGVYIWSIYHFRNPYVISRLRIFKKRRLRTRTEIKYMFLSRD